MQRLIISAVVVLDAGVICYVRDVGRRSSATSLHDWWVWVLVTGT
ncbi:hypothetical protein [Plectonema radiosum]|nr:hypothetical protein [Plectonema radiosum]